MIPVSLLLILAAVVLLALGLTGGSSGLLIGSIVASLLAAVALVVGARKGVGVRRGARGDADQLTTEMPAVGEPSPVYAGEPSSAYVDERAPGYPDEPSSVYADERAPDHASAFAEEPAFVEEPAFAAEPAFDEESADQAVYAAQAKFAAARASEESADRQARPDLSHQSAFVAGETQPMAAVDDVRPPAAAPTDAAPTAADAPGHQGDRPDEFDIPLDQDFSTPERPAADYDHASSTIGAARSANPDENAWRRDAGAAPSGIFDDDFAEPDADDPDDEPLPQAVRPADAVRVARLDAEVLVVDGRPRYHLADCSHLVGRLTEPIPVNEAVELGFSPCGLCRPVDRLVAATSRR
jgi:clumping factor A